MNDSTRIDPALLPTSKELSVATLFAGVVAAILLVTVILPAERGIDPTGVGGVLGLTALGELKQSEQRPSVPAVASTVAAPAPTVPAAPVAEAASAFRTDELTLTFEPGGSAEVKAVMRAGDQMTYTWTADKGELFFDFHGEPKGAADGVFTSFEKDSKARGQGDFEAPFEGVHGWYWKNQGTETVSMNLKTSGVYASIGRK